MCELTTLRKDRPIPVALKMRLVTTLVWTALSYGAAAWTLEIRDEREITLMETWLWRRMKRISWMEKRTDDSILQELDIKHKLLGHVCKRKLSYFGHLCRDHGCQITLRRVLDIYCQIDSSQCLAQLTPARVGKARSVHVQLGASPHVIR